MIVCYFLVPKFLIGHLVSLPKISCCGFCHPFPDGLAMPAMLAVGTTSPCIRVRILAFVSWKGSSVNNKTFCFQTKRCVSFTVHVSAPSYQMCSRFTCANLFTLISVCVAFYTSSGGLVGFSGFLTGFFYGRKSPRRDSCIAEDFLGAAGQEFPFVQLALHLDFRVLCWSIFHYLHLASLMHISLARACQCDPQESCILTKPICGLIQATTFAYLSRPEAQRVLITCILLLADQKDILLSRTERQLEICLSTYSVPTPPL